MLFSASSALAEGKSCYRSCPASALRMGGPQRITGVQELVGNGWEWTSTIFGPFDGFEPMASCPEYSAGPCDGDHYVLKGASPVTARSLVRRGFRGAERPGAVSRYTAFRTVAG